jgi:phage-related protein
VDGRDSQLCRRCRTPRAADGFESPLQRLVQVIETVGFDHLPRDATRHLEGKLWELRVIAASGIARTIYVTVTGQRVVLLRAFVKKTQKTPTRELRIAREREREVK